MPCVFLTVASAVGLRPIKSRQPFPQDSRTAERCTGITEMRSEPCHGFDGNQSRELRDKFTESEKRHS